MDGSVRRFACTMCGKCCNRSPEVELSEAAALADVFMFRLMFRIYALPRHRPAGSSASEEFYQKKRLLGAHAAHTRAVKVRRDGKVLDYVQYLTISALSLDTRAGACSALRDDSRCGIHARRPYACRTVPFHYSRVDALAERDLAAFIATDGYGCETGEGAPVVVRDGRMVDADALRDRAEALAVSEGDAAWRKAIVRRMRSGDDSLPTFEQVAASASVGALTTSMGAAWRIAAEEGLIGADECRSLVATQLELIVRELGDRRCASDARQTLLDMRAEYAGQLSDR